VGIGGASPPQSAISGRVNCPVITGMDWVNRQQAARNYDDEQATAKKQARCEANHEVGAPI
jgi:hypothetical protein